MSKYGKIADEQARLMGAASLPVHEAPVANLETDGQAIWVNPAFASEIESSAGEDGLRFVLAHELGHAHCGMHHCGHHGEFLADEFAARSLALHGGDVAAIAGVFGMLDPHDSASHPASGSRASLASSVFQRELGAKREKDERERLDDIDVGGSGAPKNPNTKDLTFAV
jgi:hypothetical protein